MTIPLNILIVEDSEADAALLLAELRSAGVIGPKFVEIEQSYKVLIGISMRAGNDGFLTKWFAPAL